MSMRLHSIFGALRTLLQGATACLLLGTCVLAAEQRAGADSRASPGMYGTYQSDASTRFDRSLADINPMTDAQLLPALLSALDQLSKYPRPPMLPALHRLPHAELQQLVCAGPCPALAIYRPGEGIYLDDKLRPETSLFDRSVLLHELVHYLQDLNNAYGGMRPCSRWYYREQEAYAIQKRFLMIVGSPVRVAYSAQSSTCDDAILR
jgi:hypothetical protein